MSRLAECLTEASSLADHLDMVDVNQEPLADGESPNSILRDILLEIEHAKLEVLHRLGRDK